MISQLRGRLLEKTPEEVVVEAAGVGYAVQPTLSCFEKLPAVGEEVSVFVHFQVREDAHQLFAFAQRRERDMFRELIRVSGIGAKTALAVLSGLSVDDLAYDIDHQLSARLVKIPGIGRKTAERLLLELKDRGAVFGAGGSGAGAVAAGNGAEAVAALVGLGYSSAQAQRVVSALDANLELPALIKLALRQLAV